MASSSEGIERGPLQDAPQAHRLLDAFDDAAQEDLGMGPTQLEAINHVGWHPVQFGPRTIGRFRNSSDFSWKGKMSGRKPTSESWELQTAEAVQCTG